MLLLVVNCSLDTFQESSDTKLWNKYVCFEEYLEKLDSFCGKPKFRSSAHFCDKTTNSAAHLKIPWKTVDQLLTSGSGFFNTARQGMFPQFGSYVSKN